MLFNRTIIRDVEGTEEEEYVFVFKVEPGNWEDCPPTHFPVREIRLLDSGWVMVTDNDGDASCFPAWRVIAIEDPVTGEEDAGPN